MDEAKITSTLQIIYNGLVHTHYVLSKFTGDLNTKIGQINMTPNDRREAYQYMVRISQTIAGLGQLINTFKRQVSDVAKPGAIIASTVKELIKIADLFDDIGESILADCIDSTAQTIYNANIVKNARFSRETLKEVEEAQMSLLNWSQMAQMDEDDRKQLRERIFALNQAISKVMSRVASKNSNEMLILANELDENGFYKLADKVDKTIIKIADYSFVPRTRKSKDEDEAPELVQPPREGSLSTRYCPDHIGVQASRISERIYQCPIDGRVYNYEVGYKNYQGQRVPGGSVAAQTPTTTDYGGIPMRIYDSRQSILNKIH